jgi:hypothetical protein
MLLEFYGPSCQYSAPSPSEHRRPAVTFGPAVLPAVLLAPLLLTATSTVLLEKLTGSQLVHKFPAFYGTRRYITPFTSTRRLSLSWARSIQSTPPPSTIQLPEGNSCTESHVPFPLLRSYPRISPGPRHIYPFSNKASFYGEELLAPRPTPKLEVNPLSAVRDCLFNIFTATLHIGGRSSKRNLRTHHVVVTPTH